MAFVVTIVSGLHCLLINSNALRASYDIVHYVYKNDNVQNHSKKVFV